MPLTRLLVPLLSLLLFVPDSVLAQPLPTAPPEAVGVSAPRLARLTELMKRYVEEGRMAGSVTLIARDGKVVYFEAAGRADVEKDVPMRRDTLFRIASQTKAVTSVAIMMLMEEGRLVLNDPVSKFIPAFASTTVAVRPPEDAAPGSPVATVKAKRPITIRDLLTHTAGIGYGNNPAREAYKAAGFDEWYFADKAEPIGHWIEKLASLPFDAQPGEAFVYGYATDILGVVVERISGQTLDEFFRTRIFEPLKMTDTFFFVPPEKRDRLATVYSLKRGGGIERAPATGRYQGAYVDGPRAAFSGGAGLVSTASDYARFLQMLLNGGELDGVRLLSPKTVELMTSNHVGTLFSLGRTGFGLGFEVTEHVGRSGRPGSVGEFGWGGAYHTKYWVDPEEKLVVVFMTQLLPAFGSDLQDKLRALVYQAIEVPGRALSSAPLRRTAVSRAR
ncbi:MAG TPA: serine hydrolase domain-containing protein [Vicinamibacterales bacterium]